MPSIFSRENLLRWLLALGCFAVLILFFSPSWGAFSLWSRVPEMSGMIEVRRGVSVLAQAAHPGTEIADPLHRAIQWRLLFPLIARVLGLPPAMLFGLSYVGALLVLGHIVALLRRRGFGWMETALASVTAGAASWFFVSTGWLGYFDSWVALGLLLVTFGDSRWTVWAACIWAPWVDERFILALPAALLCRWLRSTSPAAGETAASLDWRVELGVPAALAAGFLLVRLGLLSSQSAANATLAGYFSGRDFLDAPLGGIALGIWDGLRAGWMFAVAAIVWLRRSPVRAAALGACVVIITGAGLATAQDYSRSMTMLLPVAVLGLWLAAAAAPRPRRQLLIGTTAVALLSPAHHVMNDRVNPIFYLYHELAALQSPPRMAMPELHELRAIRSMEQGDFAAAEAELALAIKLAADPAAPARQRGVMYATQRRWEDAKRDFSTMIQHEPGNPDGWFLRSQVEFATRNLAAARADFEHARSIAPAGWTSRPDVTRYMATLQQPAGGAR